MNMRWRGTRSRGRAAGDECEMEGYEEQRAEQQGGKCEMEGPEQQGADKWT
jgi:hypothetical protein